MNRTLKLMASLAILEMLLLDAALVIFTGADLNGHDPQHRYLFQLIFFPAWTMVGVILSARRLARKEPRLSDTHRRYLETSLGAVLIWVAVVHGFIAYTRVEGLAFDQMAFRRIVTVCFGAALMVQGNFAAKLDPPTGAGAPGPAVWTRTLMRFGWAMVLLGFASVLCGLLGPPVLFTPLILLIAGVGIAAEISFRRMIRPTQRA
jgi:hypothetical protein